MRFRHILFPVDFSDRSHRAAPFVRALAAVSKAAVTLIHIVESQQRKEEAAQQLADFATEEFRDMAVTRIVEEGDPGERITELARDWIADLIMMPTHGRGGLGRKLLGSVTARVLHECPCPVWTSAHSETGHTDLKTILCAIKLEPESASLLRYTKAIALEAGASVHIVHAVPEQHALEAFLNDFARGEIAKLQMEAGTNFDSFVEPGNAPQMVCAAAEKFDADLVVIGRGVLSQFIGDLRTEAYAIIRESPCPVLTV